MHSAQKFAAKEGCCARAHSAHIKSTKSLPSWLAQARGGVGARPIRARRASAAEVSTVGEHAWPLNTTFEAWLATQALQSAAPPRRGTWRRRPPLAAPRPCWGARKTSRQMAQRQLQVTLNPWIDVLFLHT